MSIRRHFLDWCKPALPAAADWLVARCAQGGELDLGRTIVVVPGSRVGRRLLELLVARAEAQSLVLTPPTIATEQALPELLYQPQRPFANLLTQQLVWSAALQETPAAMRRHFLPHPPAAGEAARWLELGDMLRRLHSELAADGLNFQDVLTASSAIEGFTEHDRWRTLADVQQRYLHKLDNLGLWDIQTARLVAIEQREPETDREIVLIGTVDLNQTQRRLLDLVAPRVSALVVAPSSRAADFDEHGCLLPERWAEAEIPLTDEQIVRVDGPVDQAEAVTRWLAALAGKYRAEQIVVGACDERLAPQLQRQLMQSGVGSRWVEAKRLSETGPFRLLQLATQQAERLRFGDVAALMRHPDVHDWLMANVDRRALAGHEPLTILDRFATTQVPAGLDPERLARDGATAMQAIVATFEQLGSGLPATDQSLTQWAAAFRELLRAVYGSRVLDRERPSDRFLYETLLRFEKALAELEQVPRSLIPRMSLANAFQAIIAPLASEPIPPPAESNVVEILGWLELPLDDAPALCVTTFNEGFVPTSAGADTFLPNGLRKQLGLLHNDRRYARDAYAACVLASSRTDLRLIVARRDVDRNPLTPSRLLFAADEETVVRRAGEYFQPLPPNPPRRLVFAPSGSVRLFSSFVVPDPVVATAPEKLSVTAFKTYLTCPYRFYLRHVLRLEPLDDLHGELDPRAFGTLLHDVLQRFGRGDDTRAYRESTSAEEIYGFLGDYLDTLSQARFHIKHCRPAVRLQIEHARARLKALADWQAERTRQGWQIVYGEDVERQLRADFPVDDLPFQLEGRIDRIDYHPQRKVLSVLDYKTADAALPPQRTHLKAGAWIDLQLPLYRHLVRRAGLPQIDVSDCSVELGYILLPRDPRGAGDRIAQWSESQLATADETARRIVRQLRGHIYWPPATPPPPFQEDLAVITQDNRLGGWRAASDDEEEEAA